MYKKLRPAIAMIELIFAIAIMGIVLMTAPMLIQTATSGAYVAIQQESISEAASRINMILGYSWDENNTDESYPSTILTVTSGAADLNYSTLTLQRKGTPSISYRSFSDENGSTHAATPTAKFGFGVDPGETIPDDIDDFDNNITHLRDISGGHAIVDYIEKETDIDITTTVSYSTDNVAGGYQKRNITYNPFTAIGIGTSNIKTIEVTLKSATSVNELQKTITLRAFSSNIGSYVLETRNF